MKIDFHFEESRDEPRSGEMSGSGGDQTGPEKIFHGMAANSSTGAIN